MSDATPAPLPPYFEVPHDDDPVPPEIMLGGPRIRCTLDGTRLWSIEDAHLHDDHFHASKVRDVAAGRPEPDLSYLRREALDQAARVATGRETQQQLVQRAQAFEAFLRGDALAGVTSAAIEGGELDVLEQLLGFIRERTFEDASGLRSLEGQGPQDEAESILVDLSHEQLWMMAHVIAVASTLVRAAEREKR
jgi:hypothetical protein